MSLKRPSVIEYKINEKSPAIKLTMEALDITRKEVTMPDIIKPIINYLCQFINYP